MFPEINARMMTNLLLQDSAMDRQKIMDEVYVKNIVNDILAYMESHGTAEMKMKIFPSFSLLFYALRFHFNLNSVNKRSIQNL